MWSIEPGWEEDAEVHVRCSWRGEGLTTRRSIRATARLGADGNEIQKEIEREHGVLF